MTRWKPSVSSCSAPDVSGFAAVFSMGLLSLVVSSLRTGWSCSGASGLTEQLLAVGLDIGGEAERVIARALFRKFGVAFLERLDDRKMLRQRCREALGAPDRQLAIA